MTVPTIMTPSRASRLQTSDVCSAMSKKAWPTLSLLIIYWSTSLPLQYWLLCSSTRRCWIPSSTGPALWVLRPPGFLGGKRATFNTRISENFLANRLTLNWSYRWSPRARWTRQLTQYSDTQLLASLLLNQLVLVVTSWRSCSQNISYTNRSK